MPRAAFGFGLALAAVSLSACAEARFGPDVDDFIAQYTARYQTLRLDYALADWASNTRIVEGDSTNAVRTRQANEALLAFTGGTENIERVRGFLERRDELDPLQVLQLERMLELAADGPQTIPEVVKRRIALETEQVERLYGFAFHVDGEEVTPNQIDERLRKSTDLAERRRVWEASKEVGPALEPGMIELRDLRNRTVRELGYPDFFTFEVSDYGMSTDEMLALTEQLIRDLRPLYRELHTWTRHELARRYRQPVPDLIPAHWLTNRWAQDWSELVTVEGIDVDRALADKSAEWVVQQGEAFYRSLGFDPLPQTFWTESSLYPLPADAPFKKNTHASAWHVDLNQDVRSLMSVEPNAQWWGTAHHELGHIFYYQAYTSSGTPVLLRRGANRAYHEAIGTMIGMAAGQRAFLVGRGLAAADARVDPVQQLLKEALTSIVFMPFGAGTMTRFEHALYAEGLPPDQWNAKWWELAGRYQGIAPPAPRDERFADGLSKTHVIDDPAQYYDYALSSALQYQMHQHIANEILHQDPHDTDYYGSTAVGDFLRNLMAPGSSRPWRDVLRETTGRALDGRAVAEYYEPLRLWLVEQNRGRTHTLPEL
jgi:peptidyl-dipeptidase A